MILVLNNELRAHAITDYCPNGLQVEGRAEVNKIITGVTASEALIDQAIDLNADAILVHHGYFWKGEPANITGMKKARLKKLLVNDISLIAYHLPIDVHPTLGNNAQLAQLLELVKVCPVEGILPKGIVMQGELKSTCNHKQFSDLLNKKLNRVPTSIGKKSSIKQIAWCTGGGQSFIDQVVQLTAGIDAYISGEISEQTTHSALEQNIDFFAAGHHATERYGVKAVGEWLLNTHGLEAVFVDVPNPA